MLLSFLFGVYSGKRDFQNIKNGAEYAAIGAGWIFSQMGDAAKDTAKTAKRKGR